MLYSVKLSHTFLINHTHNLFPYLAYFGLNQSSEADLDSRTDLDYNYIAPVRYLIPLLLLLCIN